MIERVGAVGLCLVAPSFLCPSTIPISFLNHSIGSTLVCIRVIRVYLGSGLAFGVQSFPQVFIDTPEPDWGARDEPKWPTPGLRHLAGYSTGLSPTETVG